MEGGLLAVAIVALAALGSLAVWLRGGGQPVVLRDPTTANRISPAELEEDAQGLPPTAYDNRYTRSRRSPFPSWGGSRWAVRAGEGWDPTYDEIRERERLAPRSATEKDP